MGHHYIVGASVLALASVSPAIAADLPAKARPAPVVVSDWAGFYLGIHGGYGWKDNPFSEPFCCFGPDDATSATLGGIDSRGGLIGGHAGYNWQYGRVVAGLEVDFSATDIRGSTSATVPEAGALFQRTNTRTLDDHVAYLGSARARLGFLPTDSVLLYGAGGLAWERFKRTETTLTSTTQLGSTETFLFTSTTPADRFGWVAGVGAEARLFGSNWFGRIEYLHYDFGKFATDEEILTINGAVAGEFHLTSGRQTIDVVRAGLSYRFAPAPGSAVSAMAADYPVKAPPVHAVGAGWAGFYLGIHGGYGWSDDPFSSPFEPGGQSGGVDSRGGLIGGHAGYNWQYGRVVTGLEVDFSAANIKGSTSATASAGSDFTTVTQQDRVEYLGSLRARLGFLPTDSLLLYGTGGLGWERLERATVSIFQGINGADVFSFTESTTRPFDRFGWVAGAGAEARLFGSNWFGRVEYLHYHFGRFERSRDLDTVNGVVVFESLETSGRQTVDVVRAGLSYRFASVSGGPLSAMAADYPVKARPVPPALWSWAGFYLGVHGGYGWKDNPSSELLCCADGASTTIGGIESTGWLVGGHAGHNWQFGRVVAGLEIDLSAADLKGSTFATVSGGIETLTLSLQDRVEYLGSVRARLGFLPTDSLLLYGTAGLGWERLERTSIRSGFSGGGVEIDESTVPFDRFGWVAGAGAEARLFGSNWLGRVEYLHYDFGSLDTSLQTNDAGGVVVTGLRQTSGRQTIDVVRAGLSYKLGPN